MGKFSWSSEALPKILNLSIKTRRPPTLARSNANMAAGDQPPVENSAAAEQRSDAPSDSKPDSAATSNAPAGDGADKDVKHNDGNGGAKKRGDTGRGEWR